MRAERDTLASKGGVDVGALLAPWSIVVVGATPDLAKRGRRFLANLARYRYVGKVFAVNAKYTLEDGVEYHRDLLSLPQPVDLAALVVPARAVPGYMGQVGIKATMILSSGFAEGGNDGQALQAEIAQIAFESGIAVLGPNRLRRVDIDDRVLLNAFASGESFSGGDIAFVSQSGAMGTAVVITRADIARNYNDPIYISGFGQAATHALTNFHGGPLAAHSAVIFSNFSTVYRASNEDYVTDLPYTVGMPDAVNLKRLT